MNARRLPHLLGHLALAGSVAWSGYTVGTVLRHQLDAHTSLGPDYTCYVAGTSPIPEYSWPCSVEAVPMPTPDPLSVDQLAPI